MLKASKKEVREVRDAFRKEQRKLKKDALALAASLGVTVSPGNRGGWIEIIFPSGKKRKTQGWVTVLKILKSWAAKQPQNNGD